MIKDTIDDLQRKYPYINSIYLNRNLIGNEISDFSLTLTLSNNQVIDENNKVTIKFWNIRELKIGEIDNLFRAYISISDISNRQMEGIHYRVSEEENNLFSLLVNFWEEKLGIFKNIIDNYENLIKTKITIPLSNGEIIKFEFKPQDLPHLLGLQYLVDNPVLFEYSQERLSATDLYKGMCNGKIDIINARQIVKFNPKKIRVFTTKLDKLDYMFWKLMKDENDNYGYFGIGFMASGKTMK